ncbi:MAG: hypothetical protein IPG76_22880 [Acidobacteria bacterium]|nr:hypothetical protein [Acidobacteriota bacterium]
MDSVDPVTGVISNTITLSGQFSFDPDNWLSGSGDLGIRSYQWSLISKPAGCLDVPLPPGEVVTIFTAGNGLPWSLEIRPGRHRR